MGNDSAEYLPLVASPLSSTVRVGRFERKGFFFNICLRELFFLVVIVLQSIALVITLSSRISTANLASTICPKSGESLLYSPAQRAVEYEVKSFTSGREHKTIYQGLSDDVDRAWGELYNHTILKIPKSEAALLPNKTYPIKEEPGYYIAGLDVFHQLHCLNLVRRALNKDHYPNDVHLTEEHISHCVDSVRQSLMCNADISVNVWQWSDEVKGVVGYSTQAHSCKNFNKLLDWARDHRLHHWIDTRFYIDDELPDPPVIS
ncbi:hypothetical protein BDQ17DRAFT_1312361 [Cyathus striatus]|nr:hypothetical protein BDQ17DRAFT_1312361 [Cyathus striatus]